jgi:hypothetical protein
VIHRPDVKKPNFVEGGVFSAINGSKISYRKSSSGMNPNFRDVVGSGLWRSTWLNRTRSSQHRALGAWILLQRRNRDGKSTGLN